MTDHLESMYKEAARLYQLKFMQKNSRVSGKDELHDYMEELMTKIEEESKPKEEFTWDIFDKVEF